MVVFPALINICKSFSAHWCNMQPVPPHMHSTFLGPSPTTFTSLHLCQPRRWQLWHVTVQCLNYLSSLITLQILEECMLGLLIFKMAESIMHLSISIPTSIDQQAKGQNCNLLLQPVCRLRMLIVIHMKSNLTFRQAKLNLIQQLKMHLPSLNPRLKSEKVTSNHYSVRSLQKTAW